MLVAVAACAGATTMTSPAVQAAPTCGATPADWQGTGGKGVTYSGTAQGLKQNVSVTINLNAGTATMTATPSTPLLDKLKEGKIIFHSSDAVSVLWGVPGDQLGDVLMAGLGEPDCSSGSEVTSASFVVNEVFGTHQEQYIGFVERTA